MIETNSDWLGQVSDDLFLHGDFHHIIQNPGVLVTLLKHTQTRLYLLRKYRTRITV